MTDLGRIFWAEIDCKRMTEKLDDIFFRSNF